MIPESFITELLSRLDIVEVIGQYVKLQHKGANWMACCPFHKEKTPSFAVNQSKQFYKCFGCGKSGTAIKFLMEFKGLTFPEAVEELARSVGMQVPVSAKASREEKVRLSLYDYTAKAADFYAASLAKNPRAQAYLKDRGISEETQKKFHLGFSPEGWQSLESVFHADYQKAAVVDAGLVITKENSRYDRFRGRVMYPIRNTRGQVIGFGARTMVKDEDPKYLNSPDSAIYHKGLELYGLYEARESIRQKGRAIVCEGYMDVIQMSQGGFTETVAALGTSITADHVKKLFTLTDDVYFSFDGDEAGFKAANRALVSTLSMITNKQKAYFLMLPQGEDPDSIVKDQGAEGFEAQLANAYPLSKFFVLDVIRQATGNRFVKSQEDKAACIEIAKPLLKSMKADALCRMIAEELALAIGVNVDQIAKLTEVSVVPRIQSTRRLMSGYGRDVKQSAKYGKPVKSIAVGKLQQTTAKRLLQCLLIHPSWFFEFAEPITFFEKATNLYERLTFSILQKLSSALPEGNESTATLGTVLALLEGDTALSVVTDLIDEEEELQTPEDLAYQEIQSIFIERDLKDTGFALNEAVATGQPQEVVSRLLARQNALRDQLKALRTQSVDEAFTS